MNKSGFSYFKFTTVVAVLAVSLIGLSGLFCVTTMAQDQDNETVKREIDLREKLKDKKFEDGRRVEIHALSNGEKLVAEIKDRKFVNLFLVASDGTEVKGVVRSAVHTTNVQTCTATITTTTKERKGLHMVTITTTTIVQFPAPRLSRLPGPIWFRRHRIRAMAMTWIGRSRSRSLNLACLYHSCKRGSWEAEQASLSCEPARLPPGGMIVLQRFHRSGA